MDKAIVLVFAISALTGLNIAAFKYIGIFGFIVTAASIPFAKEILEIIGKM